MGAKCFEVLNNLDSSNGSVCRKALNSIFLFFLSSPSIFNFIQHPNVFINLHLNSIHRGGLPLLKGRSSNLRISTSWAMLSTLKERLSNLYNFSSTLLL